jgi:deoxyadenosine/deoxycytidine kinase
MMEAQPIILLNGWPGVGKDTIAETLSLLIGDNKASMLNWSKGRSENFQTIPDDDEVAQKVQRDACLADQVENPSTFKKMIICTDCLSDTPLGRRLAQDFEVVAKRTNRMLIPIYLECQVEENMRRLQQAERRVSLKDKSKSSQLFLLQFIFLVSHPLLRHIQMLRRQGENCRQTVLQWEGSTANSNIDMPVAVTW